MSPTAIMHDATCASTEKHGAQSQRAAAAADEDQAVDGSCLDGGSARQQQQQQHEWTIDKHLANDPRNYKFLPRWARSGEGVKFSACGGVYSSDLFSFQFELQLFRRMVDELWIFHHLAVMPAAEGFISATHRGWFSKVDSTMWHVPASEPIVFIRLPCTCLSLYSRSPPAESCSQHEMHLRLFKRKPELSSD